MGDTWQVYGSYMARNVEDFVLFSGLAPVTCKLPHGGIVAELFGVMIMKQWIRTCQECGLEQAAKPPEDWKSDKWRDVKCKRCKSEALDYGKWINTDAKPESDPEEFIQ